MFPRLKEVRETLGLSQTQMASAMGVHRNLWLKWERDEQRITAAPLRQLEIWLKLHNEYPNIYRVFLDYF